MFCCVLCEGNQPAEEACIQRGGENNQAQQYHHYKLFKKYKKEKKIFPKT